MGGRPTGSRPCATVGGVIMVRTHSASVCSKGSSSVGEHHADVLLRSPSRSMLTIECFRPCDEHALCRSVVEPIDFLEWHGPGKNVDAAALAHSVEESEIFREPAGVLHRTCHGHRLSLKPHTKHSDTHHQQHCGVIEHHAR